MKTDNIKLVNDSFAVQAANFENRDLNFSKEKYLTYTLSEVNPGKEDVMLEVAAGTCVCGRSFASHVKQVVCLDATVPMLQVGQQEAEKQHIGNMIFVKGYAQELPFLDRSFDIVFSRLAFHHFTDTKQAFSEMVRVLRPGGKLVMIDMEAAQEELRRTEDEIETMRDPSHVKKLSKQEMDALFSENGLTIVKSETTQIEQHLDRWMALTKTPEPVQKEIIFRMKEEIAGHAKTGVAPYEKEGEICFKHRWVLTIGTR